MSYTKDDLTALGVKDIDSTREKIVDISLFDNIDNISLSDKTLEKQDLALELYNEYIENLYKLSKDEVNIYLSSLMNAEVIDSHLMEQESMKYLLNFNTHQVSALKYLLKKLDKEGLNLNSDIIKRAHKILLRGTSLENSNTDKYRQSNDNYVGYIDNGQIIYNYFPISYDEINQAVTLLVEYYNNSFDNLFAKSFIIHALLGVLQLFNDGNTRLGRSIQHISMYKSTNRIFDTNFKLPIIYLSKTYTAFRYEYRNILTKIAINPDNASWDEWIKFNYEQLIGQILINEEQLSRKLKK